MQYIEKVVGKTLKLEREISEDVEGRRQNLEEWRVNSKKWIDRVSRDRHFQAHLSMLTVFHSHWHLQLYIQLSTQPGCLINNSKEIHPKLSSWFFSCEVSHWKYPSTLGIETPSFQLHRSNNEWKNSLGEMKTLTSLIRPELMHCGIKKEKTLWSGLHGK